MYIYTYIYIYHCCCLVAKLCPTLCDPLNIACQAPQSIGFFRHEYWNGLSFPPPGDLPDPGIEPASPTLAGRFFNPEPPGKSYTMYLCSNMTSDSTFYL